MISKGWILSPYERHSKTYGGFGVGTISGGHGAGHGFHIVLND